MISWRDEDGGLHAGSLFAVFAALSRGEAWSFPALRPHQREPWHAFTVQVAALALIGAGQDRPPETEAGWRDLLHALTPGQPEAWELVVDDWSRPALLQPPIVAAANRGDYKNRLFTPDALDMLVTSRNHDVKQERIAAADEETWLFALMTLQTGEGYGGSGNHGISRMNGGLSNRMSLSVRPGGGTSAAFLRDLRRLVADARARPDRRIGLALLWTEPWDGTVSLDFSKLDELYVEICRRTRLLRTPAGIEAMAGTSKCTRVAGKELKGRTLDPWAPIKASGEESVTAAANGFGYRSMTRLLDRKIVTRPLLAEVAPDDAADGLTILAAALVRGQGKTEGLHRRLIRTSRINLDENTGDELVLDRVGAVAERRSLDAGEASKRLRRALLSLVQGGPEQVRLDDDAGGKKVDPWVRRFDARVDDVFFDGAFWSERARDAVPHRRPWRERLRAIAGIVFDEAAEAAPRTDVRRVRALARSRSYLDAQFTKWLEEVPDGE